MAFWRLTFPFEQGSYKVKEKKSPKKSALEGRKKGRRTMRKQWMRRLAAVSLILAVGTGAGTVLHAKEEEIAGKSGGGYFQN